MSVCGDVEVTAQSMCGVGAQKEKYFIPVPVFLFWEFLFLSCVFLCFLGVWECEIDYAISPELRKGQKQPSGVHNPVDKSVGILDEGHHPLLTALLGLLHYLHRGGPLLARLGLGHHLEAQLVALDQLGP